MASIPDCWSVDWGFKPHRSLFNFTIFYHPVSWIRMDFLIQCRKTEMACLTNWELFHWSEYNQLSIFQLLHGAFMDNDICSLDTLVLGQTTACSSSNKCKSLLLECCWRPFAALFNYLFAISLYMHFSCGPDVSEWGLNLKCQHKPPKKAGTETHNDVRISILCFIYFLICLRYIMWRFHLKHFRHLVEISWT